MRAERHAGLQVGAPGVRDERLVIVALVDLGGSREERLEDAP